MPSSSPRSRPPGRPSSDATWGARLFRDGRCLLAGLTALFATYLGLCVAALLVYSSFFPPLTGVQMQRHLEAAVAGTSYDLTYQPRPLSQMDADLRRAVVAGEDSRFFKHHGIDWKAIHNAVTEYLRGEGLRGGSSITQQLVKNLFMTTHSTVLRKALEVPLTYAAELVMSKRRILELYINVIEWGPGTFGAEAAAQHHYGRSAQYLTRYQAAALAACIPNPLDRTPQTVGGYTRIILRRMYNLGRLPLSAADSSSWVPALDMTEIPLPHAIREWSP